MNQRWRLRRDMYRPAGEVIDTRAYEIAQTTSDSLVREFISTHHYLQTTPPARFRFCLYKGQELVGVAVFAHPTNDRSITSTFGCAAVEGVELSRLVLLDEVPGNGESHFVGHCLRQLKRLGLAGVVTFSDPMPRTTAPDPARRHEVQKKLAWASQQLEWAERQRLFAEARQMKALTQDCNLMLQEMDLIETARVNERQIVTIQPAKAIR